MRLLPIAIVLAMVAYTGCGTSGDRADAAGVVEHFYDAVRHHDGEEACAQLTAAAVSAVESDSGQTCRRAITRLDLQGGAVTRAQVYLTSALVQLRGGDSAFLDRGPQGWRISAVACRPENGPAGNVPMQCEAQA